MKLPRHPELERMVRENPSYRQPREVYADWLLQQGDFRGELMQLEAAMSMRCSSEDFRRMAARLQELRREMADVLAPEPDPEVTITPRPEIFPWERVEFFTENPEVIRRVLNHDSACLLQSVHVWLDGYFPERQEEVFEVLARWKGAADLPCLTLGGEPMKNARSALAVYGERLVF